MILVLFLLASFTSVLSQSKSPCPETFIYESKGSESDRWYGVISLRTAEDLTGIWLHIILDRPADLLGNWFGEASSSDNTEFTIRNPKYKLEAGPPVSVRFFVKYDVSKTVPSLKTIRLNGKTICSIQQNLRPTTPTLHISQQVRPTEPSRQTSDEEFAGSYDNRPINSNGSNRPTSNGIHRPSRPTEPSRHSNEDEYESRPSSVTRPSSSSRPSSGNSNNRPSSSSGSNSNRPGSSSGSNGSRPSSSSKPNSNGGGRPGTSGNRESSWNNQKHENGNGHESTEGYSSGGSGIALVAENTDLDFFPGDFANVSSAIKPASRPSTVQARKPGCGTVAMKASPLISYGQNTTQGQWPWHAALYHSKGIQLMYTCGGTLISEEHILTAAHCVTKPQTDQAVNSRYILVYLGKYNILTFGTGVQDRDVEEIYVHPEYNHSVYFNDIAILKLSRPVELTNFVRPCCLWDEDTDLDSIVGKQGTVVGWGFDEHRQLSNNLMQAQMPVVKTITCIYSNREFFSQFTFEKNYCAGFRNGTSVCNGDSGGGMVFPRSGTHGQVWQIRGLVSVGVALQGQGVCDPSQYIVFTDIAKHLRWIKRTINY